MNPLPDVALRIDELGVVLGAHAGGIELVEIVGGVARVRYTGMCTGCPLRPLTTASTVRPALLELDGIESVEVEGSRISAEAEARLVAAFRKSGLRWDSDLLRSEATPIAHGGLKAR
jgi:Fe-S cluster biogenesis protein NfuA